MSRLEEIKEFAEHLALSEQDLYWLIQQAERVEELESLEKSFDELDSDYIDIQKENIIYETENQILKDLLKEKLTHEEKTYIKIKYKIEL